MRRLKIFIFLAVFSIFTNPLQAQVEAIFYILAGLRGVGGGISAKAGEIHPSIVDFDIADVNKLAEMLSRRSANPADYRGLTIYNPGQKANTNASLPEGMYTWNGQKWENTYSKTPTGSLKGDLQALYDIQHHPKNKGIDDWNDWQIDLNDPTNIKNLSLNGVFFKKINGEYRVVELRLEWFSYRDISIQKGLEATVYCSISKNSKVENIDLTLPNAIYLNLEENQLVTKVNLNCPKLALARFCGNPNLETLAPLSTRLYNLSCSRNNKLTTFSLPKAADLQHLSVYQNRLLKNLDVSKNAKLLDLFCSDNQLTSLDVTKNISLTSLNCVANKLTVLNLANNRELKSLTCYANQLTALDVSNNPKLENLGCSENALTMLDLSNNPDLTHLYCDDNRLTKLDVSKQTKLVELMCSKNQLTKLNVNHNRALTKLWCGANQLTTLDVSANQELQLLDCASNQLPSIDVSKMPKLEELKCNFNKLTALDLSASSKLKQLICHSNNLISRSIRICSSALSNASFSSFTYRADSKIYEVLDCE